MNISCKNRLRYSRERGPTSFLHDQGSRAVIWNRSWPRSEVDGTPVAPLGRHCAGEPSHARFLGLDMQLLHRVRWLVRHHHDETGSCFFVKNKTESIHHQFVRIAEHYQNYQHSDFGQLVDGFN